MAQVPMLQAAGLQPVPSRGLLPPGPSATLALSPEVFHSIDLNRDGMITREEWQRHAFDAFDQDGDGAISREEFIRGLSPPSSPTGSSMPVSPAAGFAYFGPSAQPPQMRG